MANKKGLRFEAEKQSRSEEFVCHCLKPGRTGCEDFRRASPKSLNGRWWTGMSADVRAT
jgi:hypothetical protein